MTDPATIEALAKAAAPFRAAHRAIDSARTDIEILALADGRLEAHADQAAEVVAALTDLNRSVLASAGLAFLDLTNATGRPHAMTARTLSSSLDRLHESDASRDHLLKDGMRLLNAAEVAYLLGFRDYRNAYREGIPRGKRGWLAKDVKQHIERGRSAGVTAAQATRRSRARPSTDAPMWGPEAA